MKVKPTFKVFYKGYGEHVLGPIRLVSSAKMSNPQSSFVITLPKPLEWLLL